MRILAIERELPVPVYRNLRELPREEAAAVWDLQKRGFIREIWCSKADHRAVVMLECADVAEAREHLATLPFVRASLIDFTLLELCPYDGLESLFAGHRPPAAAAAEEPPEY